MSRTPTIDWSELIDQPALKQIESKVIAHEPMLLVGHPGIGKTMIARRIATLIPELTEHERVWLHAEYTGANMLAGYSVTDNFTPPFRAPHHTISAAALVGRPAGTEIVYDGIKPTDARRYRPSGAGELHLARFGVLFLDELSEFPRASIEALGERLRRMPKSIRPLVVGATNPCPCGWYGARVIKARECSCTPEMIERYTQRVAEFMIMLGMDTCTAGIELAELTLASYRDASVPRAEPSALVRERIAATRRGYVHLGIEL